MFTATPNSTAGLKLGRRRKAKGSIGDLTRASTATKAAAAIADSNKPPRTNGWSRPSGRASITAPISAARHTAAKPWPGRSSPRPWRLAGARATRHRVRAAPIAQSGALTQKMLRQPPAASSRPPITGPSAMETPPAAVHRPTDRARSFASCPLALFTNAREVGTSKAAPRPWPARATISQAASGAKAQATDARAKIANPAR